MRFVDGIATIDWALNREKWGGLLLLVVTVAQVFLIDREDVNEDGMSMYLPILFLKLRV